MDALPHISLEYFLLHIRYYIGPSKVYIGFSKALLISYLETIGNYEYYLRTVFIAH